MWKSIRGFFVHNITIVACSANQKTELGLFLTLTASFGKKSVWLQLAKVSFVEMYTAICAVCTPQSKRPELVVTLLAAK